MSPFGEAAPHVARSEERFFQGLGHDMPRTFFGLQTGMKQSSHLLWDIYLIHFAIHPSLNLKTYQAPATDSNWRFSEGGEQLVTKALTSSACWCCSSFWAWGTSCSSWQLRLGPRREGSEVPDEWPWQVTVIVVMRLIWRDISKARRFLNGRFDPVAGASNLCQVPCRPCTSRTSSRPHIRGQGR